MNLVQKISDIRTVKFGTSGVRGLVTDMTDEVCYTYTLGFLHHLLQQGSLKKGMEVALAGDLRQSTPRIMAAICAAIKDFGCLPVNCGNIPTPALAYYGIQQKIPSIMVTGSHIPDDRNGIKFYTPHGEILKGDEQGISRQEIAYDPSHFTEKGGLATQTHLPDINGDAYTLYVERYLNFFPQNHLHDLKIGLYEHSSVARDVLKDILQGLGAHVIPLNRSDRFIPVDTEAIRAEDKALAKQWTAEHQLFCIISTDGDGDRPLISDENGLWIRGDVAGILCAKALNAQTVATPVNSNSAVDLCNFFKTVIRTRIGSPFVIQGMQSAPPESLTVGYEANGGFLLAQDITRDGKTLKALPTRDSTVVPLCLIFLALEQKRTLSQLLQTLPQRFTSSNRLKEFPSKISAPYLARMSTGNFENDSLAIQDLFGELADTPRSINTTDGVRVSLQNGDIIHLRPSGNAPELRCYTESDSPEQSQKLNEGCLNILKQWSS